MDITPENQATARFRLVTWARIAQSCGKSADEWMEDPEVLEYMKEKELDENLLAHIYHWVWKGLNH